MEILRLVLVALHFFGFAALFAGFLGQLKAEQRATTPGMLHGALTQLVTGVVLVGLAEMAAVQPVNHAKIAVKLLVLLAALVLVWRGRNRATVPNGVFFAIGGLTALNVLVAVFWQ